MDVTIINPFIASTFNMFKEMFSFTPTCGKAHLVKKQGEHRWDISGIIGVVGNEEGVIVIRLARTLAYKLLKEMEMSGGSQEEINSLISGMVGEFINIISGNAINALTDKKVDITVPIVIQGENHTISWPNIGPIIGLPFQTPYGPFEIQINFK